MDLCTHDQWGSQWKFVLADFTYQNLKNIDFQWHFGGGTYNRITRYRPPDIAFRGDGGGGAGLLKTLAHYMA